VLLSLLIGAVVALAAPGAARACKLPGPLPAWRVELTKDSPGRILTLDARLTRGDAGALTERDCDGNAFLDLVVTGTAQGEVGYTVALVDGALPTGLELPSHMVLRDAGGHIHFHWPDLDPWPAAVDFTLEVTPVNGFGLSGESARVHVEGDAPPPQRCVLLLLLWPIALLVRLCVDRLALDYHTVTLADGAIRRPEREWFVAPRRLRLGHHRAGVVLDLLAATAAAYATLWCAGRFGIVAVVGVALLLQAYASIVVRVHRTPLPLGRWLLERFVRARVRRAGAPVSLAEALATAPGARVCVRARVRAGAGDDADAVYRRVDVHDGLSREVVEWPRPFELADDHGGRLAVDLRHAWMVGARRQLADGDEVVVAGVLWRRTVGIGRQGDPFRGDVEVLTLVAPDGESLLVS
jgi:hypothetical protein